MYKTQAPTRGQNTRALQTHLPERVPLFREKLEVFLCQLQRWECVEFHVRPRAKKGGQVDERVKTQSIIAIVGQVGHEYTDLEWRKTERGGGGDVSG